jgi:hypothetical protein
MVTLFNSTLDIGQILNATTLNVTGSDSLTYMLLFLLIIMIALLFRSPMVLVFLISIPLIVILAVAEGVGGLFFTILSIILIIVGWQFAKILMGWGR